jgi:hypothetical protein
MRGYNFRGHHEFQALVSGASVSRKWVGVAFAVALLASGFGCSRAKPEAAKTQVVIADPNVIQMDAPERFVITDVGTQSVFDEIRVNGTVTPDVSRTVPVLSLAGGARLISAPALETTCEKVRCWFASRSATRDECCVWGCS